MILVTKNTHVMTTQIVGKRDISFGAHQVVPMHLELPTDGFGLLMALFKEA